MSEHEKYVVFCAEGIEKTPFLCDSEEEAEKHAADLIQDSSIDSVAIYKLQKTGVRQSSVQWTNEKPKQQTLSLEAPNGNDAHHYQPWTTDEDVYLVDARKAKIPYTNIAVALGRTTHAVEVQASRLRCG